MGVEQSVHTVNAAFPVQTLNVCEIKSSASTFPVFWPPGNSRYNAALAQTETLDLGLK